MFSMLEWSQAPLSSLALGLVESFTPRPGRGKGERPPPHLPCAPCRWSAGEGGKGGISDPTCALVFAPGDGGARELMR